MKKYEAFSDSFEQGADRVVLSINPASNVCFHERGTSSPSAVGRFEILLFEIIRIEFTKRKMGSMWRIFFLFFGHARNWLRYTQ